MSAVLSARAEIAGELGEELGSMNGTGRMDHTAAEPRGTEKAAPIARRKGGN